MIWFDLWWKRRLWYASRSTSDLAGLMVLARATLLSRTKKRSHDNIHQEELRYPWLKSKLNPQTKIYKKNPPTCSENNGGRRILQISSLEFTIHWQSLFPWDKTKTGCNWSGNYCRKYMKYSDGLLKQHCLCVNTCFYSEEGGYDVSSRPVAAFVRVFGFSIKHGFWRMPFALEQSPATHRKSKRFCPCQAHIQMKL